MAPITRIPQGESATRERPSTLDYALMHSSVKSSISIDWKYAPADHVWVKVTVYIPVLPIRRKEQTVWRPTSYDEARRDMHNHIQHIDITKANWSDITRHLKQWQKTWATTATAKQRRHARVPMQARSLYKRAAEHDKIAQHEEARLCRSEAWSIIR